jgi:hypothetical protein
VWADRDGVDRIGNVMVVDQLVYPAREVAKTDARPGNYVATGGSGGPIGNVEGPAGRPVITAVPSYLHTHRSKLKITTWAPSQRGVRSDGQRVHPVEVKILDGAGKLRAEAMPVVIIMKFGRYPEGCCGPHQLDGWVAHALTSHPFAGVVGEGTNPYGYLDPATDRVLAQLTYSGVPVVKCGRGNTAGFTPREHAWAISGNNLTSTKARILLMAAMLKLGALPPASDLKRPTAEELHATTQAIARYQEEFDAH